MTAFDYPKITVVTPNYNLGDYLEQTILSVINQDYPNLEYILIDGGSTDQSLSIIEKYKQHFTYWESAKDKGMYHALNKGFSRSTGEIMCWINSDDMLHPNCLHTVARYFLKYPQAEWIQGYPNVYDLEGKVLFSREPFYDRYFFLLKDFQWYTRYIQQESTFWKRSLWEKSGGKLSESYKAAGDFDLWMRFFEHAPLYCVKEYLGGFRSRPDQLSGNQEQYIEEALRVIDNQILNLPLLPKALYLFEKIKRKLRQKLKLEWRYKEPTYLTLTHEEHVNHL